MATNDDATKHFFPPMQRSTKKSSRIMKRKPARKNSIPTHFRFGGNRKDPLNLNALIEKKKQSAAAAGSSSSMTNANNDNLDNGNDRPVEILLQPDIFDPLRLDTTSRNDDELNTLYSIPSNSTNEAFAHNPMTFTNRKNRYGKKRRHSLPPRYGNFQGYYGYRQPSHDQRLQYLEQNWFQNKQVLDIGCHTGHVTFYVAEHFQPAQIVGMDIDQQLIQRARHQLWNRIQTYSSTNSNNTDHNGNNANKCYPFNLHFQQSKRRMLSADRAEPERASEQPRIWSTYISVTFYLIYYGEFYSIEQGNFVLENDVDLANIVAEYDTIIAFSVTKWVHLNFGDPGLKRFFKRVYQSLLPGGSFLLEPQPWSSYRLKRRMTKELTEMYNQIEFKPTEFVSYLLSTEVGFETCTTIATPDNTHKGFQRSMFLFVKSASTVDQ
ncbi:unnamed protein product [Adineta ricciae]|uniref:RNA methyltransferase n=2 Tax=Adineta ricciae TaxID=249248 RepID=A0A814GX56_ADIRI|nr:unnamed protein product [Adineta ricciae]